MNTPKAQKELTARELLAQAATTRELVELTGLSAVQISHWRTENYIYTPWLKLLQFVYPHLEWHRFPNKPPRPPAPRGRYIERQKQKAKKK